MTEIEGNVTLLSYFLMDLLQFPQNSVNKLVNHHIKVILFETSTF